MSRDNIRDSYNNLSDNYRYSILEDELKKKDRLEDLKNIIDLMSPPKEIKSICESVLDKKVRIAIIGAGLAGLSAALELKKIGCNIVIFEPSQRIGGKTYTYYFDRFKNCYGDFGEITIPISHYTTWHYINLFNLETEKINTDINYYYIRNSGSYNNESSLENIYSKYNLSDEDKIKLNRKDHINLLNKYLIDLMPDERKELISIKEKYSEKIKELDKLTLKKAYEIEGFSEEAINLIGYLMGTKEYLNYSLLEILEKEYTLDSKNNYSIKGGMIKLPFALYNALINNESSIYIDVKKEQLGSVDIRFESLIEEISYIKEEKINIKYKNLESNLIETENFDYLIYTEPIGNLRRVDIKEKFSFDKLRAIEELSLVNSQKIYLYLKERFWEKNNDNKFIKEGRTITDLPIYSIYYPKYEESLDKEDHGVLLASYVLGDKSINFTNLNEEIKIDDTIKYIEKIHNLPKGYLDSILLDYNSLSWSDIKYIWGFSTMFKPEEKTLYSYGIIKSEVNNKIFFAGESVSTKHGTQQGELQSGMIAANKIAEDILKS